MNVSSEVLFIGGRSGVGKSSLGLQIHGQLSAAGVRHCLIEGDYLDMAYPEPAEHGLAEQNLAAVWANYRALGYRRLIYTNTASVLGEVTDQLTSAMGDNPRVFAVLLTCTDETARQRLSRREIGTALNEHLERSAEAASLLDSDSPGQVRRLQTDGRSLVDVAGEVLGITGWLPTEPMTLGR
ncbi:ABC-type glutathione transport system ATPase component [Mycobacterium frederiksbergense]|uniref:ABC-type glutathione transport system ATPase component n=1 Tax=Mycolicibacterium frederiksbergense TaxID=117567 RepID=A0ABT6KZ72_9MYCO|nr:ATPase [Mycolicibacterium frederiksbergense]MDH6195125.1 ABC-type glutathione transport system ATPase component [Mycolicibacterium frederiksbergense]